MIDEKNKVIKRCVFCPKYISEKNMSGEHIIPNSIGGRKKTYNFICASCNGKFGSKWEAELAKQFLWFSIAVGIKRERGFPPPLKIKTASGTELQLRHDGTMTPLGPEYIKDETEEGKIKIKIVARTMDELKEMVNGTVKKYPEIVFGTAMENLAVEKSYLDSPIAMNIQFGGPDVGRSIVKTALALASESGVNIKDCHLAVEYLKDENALPPFGFCYTIDLVKNRPSNEIFHCVAVRGIKESKKIIGYIEYFNVARFLVELGDKYGGEDFYYSYSLDPTTGIEGDIEINLDLNNEEISLIVGGDGMPLNKFTEALEYAVPLALERNMAGNLIEFYPKRINMLSKISESNMENNWIKIK